mmetsp:Transcript_3520/g.4126  ORF Transcript_3520/g.4126 Transcript_3520/m.4126 type:complete len:80 (+) Transcript_3520:221-460(+)
MNNQSNLFSYQENFDLKSPKEEESIISITMKKDWSFTQFKRLFKYDCDNQNMLIPYQKVSSESNLFKIMLPACEEIDKA